MGVGGGAWGVGASPGIITIGTGCYIPLQSRVFGGGGGGREALSHMWQLCIIHEHLLPKDSMSLIMPKGLG